MARSLDLIQGQPIRFGFDEQACRNNDNRAYCNLVQDGDLIQYQDRRTTGTDVGCNFADTGSVQIVTNSGFTGSAASWTLIGGFSYSANTITISAASGTATQAVTVTDQAMYRIVVELTATLTGDDLLVLLSGATVATIPVGSVAGEYTFYAVADTGAGTLSGVSTGGNNISTTVTKFEMYQVVSCFTFDVTDGTASYDPQFGLSINGNVVVYVDPTFAAATTYSPKTTITIKDYITGTVEFVYDGDSTGAIAGVNGETTRTLNGTNDTVVGIAFIDFTGTLTDVEVVQLSDAYSFNLYDLDGVLIKSLDSFVSYCNDYIELYYDPQSDSLDYGCYYIGLTDPSAIDDFFSNCISFKAEHECTKMIVAQTFSNLGFSGDCNFLISQRFRVLNITPTYKISPSSDFISSDSTRTLISGTGMKFYTLLFDFMDEVAHDVVMTLILSKTFYMGDAYSGIFQDGKRYFVLPQDYTPEWDKDHKTNLAKGRILIMEQDQVKFTTNCG